MTYDIKRWRQILGLSQEKAADLLGVHRVTYNRWENDAFPAPKSVELACESYLSHYPGNNSNKAILKSREEYKNAYLIYFNCLPKGKHLVSTPWLPNKYKLIDFTPADNL
jgi:transcriptional regulator with XRE-family HTH domain